MIEKLIIRNVALIDLAQIDFCEGLNILSGETGAGKSVILDSINFVLGAKADKTMIRHGEVECSVQAVFSVPAESAAVRALHDMDIDCDGEIIVSRKFTAAGKNSIKVNGMPVTAAMLRQVTAYLVDVHGQSEHFFLLKESNQLKVLDQVCGGELLPLKEELSGLRAGLKDCEKKLAALGGDEAERGRRMDILRFQIDEISNANPLEGEEEELLQKRNKFNNAEKIATALQTAVSCLSDEHGALDALCEAEHAVSSIARIDEEYGKLSERLDSMRLEAEDIASTLSDLGEGMACDPAEIEAVENRLDTLRMLKRKYGADLSAILEFAAHAQEEYDMLLHCDEEAEKLNGEIESYRQKLYRVCRKLTELRKQAASGFTARVERELQTLNIRSARFTVEFSDYTQEDIGRVTAEGMDSICFLFSANAGEPLKPLGKIISGGEMSRFMLAIKTQLSAVNEISTYIFDEIDAGISGMTARVVAEKFAQIARTTQIIAVSHLAQIAAMADREMFIEKQESDGKTHTTVRTVNGKEREDELIRLIGGEVTSISAREHARELLLSSRVYKDKLRRAEESGGEQTRT